MSPRGAQAYLLRLATQPSLRRSRIATALAGILASTVLFSITWWFWDTVIHGAVRPKLDVVGPVAIIILATATFSGIIGSVLLAAGRTAAAGVLEVAARMAGVGLVIVAINTAIAFARHSQLHGMRGLWESFIDFNRIQVAGVGFSITGTLTLLLIAAAVSSVLAKQSK